jgi:ribosomal protein S18 acetylase RimI-like enzyme
VGEGCRKAVERRRPAGEPAQRTGAATLVDLGAPEVLSAPVFGADLPTWARAGFVKHRQLVVMRSALRAGVPARGEAVVVTPETVADLDRLAFTTDWQIGRVGIADALRATPLSVLLAIGGDRPSGFVIVGVAGTAGYLQRIAVLPSSQGRGIGRQLLRHAMSWARRAGATSMVLNTQPDNTTAIALYQSEGFATLPQRLSVMRWRGEVGESAPPPR